MCSRLFGFNVGDQCIGDKTIGQVRANVSQESIAEITNSLYENYKSDMEEVVLNPSRTGQTGTSSTTAIKVANGVSIECPNNLRINRRIYPAYMINKDFVDKHANDIRKTVSQILT